MKRLEQQVLLRDLYNDEILEKSKVTEKEVKARYEEMARQDEVHARHIVVSDSIRAQDIVKKARAAQDFAELAKEYSEDPSTAALGGDLGFFAKESQDSSEFFRWAFTLKPGEVSDPFRTPFGWHILKVEETRKRQLEPYDKLKTRIESMLIMNKRRDLATDFLSKTREKHNFELKDDAIRTLATAVWSCTTDVGAAPAEILKQFPGDQKGLALATTKEGKYTLAQFAEALEAAQVTAIPAAVTFEDMRSMVESEALADPLALEAKRLGVHKKANVKKDLARLKEEKMVDLLYRRQIRDSVEVNDQEVFEYYQEHSEDYGTPAVLYLRKLVVESKSTADSLAALARRGRDFKALVRENSVDGYTKQREGAWETTVGKDAVIDSLTKDLGPGEIAGPYETREGFVILQFSGRKAAVPTPLELAWPHVERDVKRIKEEAKLEKLLGNLKEKYKPEINEKVLAEIQLGAAPEEAPPKTN
jgi:parvulin-like peptidyl-prolyl isomerase